MEPKKVRSLYSCVCFLNFFLLQHSTRFLRKASSSIQVLCDVKGLSEAKIDKMLEAAKKICNRGMFQTALELDAVYKREIGEFLRVFLCLFF
jgi:hypothetical protein